MKKARVKTLRDNEQKIEEDLVLKEGKVYILKDKELRLEVIQLYYNMLVARHEGRQKIMKLVTRNYQWPKVTRYMGRYMEECDLCQKIKNRTEIPVEKLMANKVPEKHRHI